MSSYIKQENAKFDNIFMIFFFLYVWDRWLLLIYLWHQLLHRLRTQIMTWGDAVNETPLTDLSFGFFFYSFGHFAVQWKLCCTSSDRRCDRLHPIGTFSILIFDLPLILHTTCARFRSVGTLASHWRSHGANNKCISKQDHFSVWCFHGWLRR